MSIATEQSTSVSTAPPRGQNQENTFLVINPSPVYNVDFLFQVLQGKSYELNKPMPTQVISEFPPKHLLTIIVIILVYRELTR